MKGRDLACRSDVGTSHSVKSVASARLMSSRSTALVIGSFKTFSSSSVLASSSLAFTWLIAPKNWSTVFT
jgi:hypothetical protein